MILNHRDQFPDLIDAMGCQTAAELGVGSGCYSAVLLRSGVSRLWMVDHWSEASSQQYETEAVAVAAGSSGRAKIVRSDCMDWLREQPDGSVDFIYLDTNHAYEVAAVQIPECWRVAGKILAGHDYSQWNQSYNCEVGIVLALEEFSRRVGREVHVTGCATSDLIDRLHAARAGAMVTDPGPWGCNVASWWLVKGGEA